MVNIRLHDINLYQDVMSKNNAAILSKLMPRSQVLKLIQKSSRDSARTPMQWSGEKNAGFSTGVPWFFVNKSYKSINVKDQEEDPDSILNFYRKLLHFRKNNPVAIYGDYVEYMPEDKNMYVYERNYHGRKLLVICSFTSEQIRFDAPEEIDLLKGSVVLSNYEMNFVIANGFTTRPYEMRVYLFE